MAYRIRFLNVRKTNTTQNVRLSKEKNVMLHKKENDFLLKKNIG